MYLNLFKRTWCHQSLIDFLMVLPFGFRFHITNVQHDIILKPTFRERYVSAIIIHYGDSGYLKIVTINNRIEDNEAGEIIKTFQQFIQLHSPATPQPIQLSSIQKELTQEVQKALGIDNNIEQDKEKRITFCINQYTDSERAKIISFLEIIDENSPDVFIEIDLSCCTIEQVKQLENTLLCASAKSNANQS